MNIVSCSNITKDFKDFKLNIDNFNISQGEVVGLIGENGAGKSTLINLIMGSLIPDTGSIKLFGKDNQDDDINIIKEDIGVVLEDAYYSGTFTSKDINQIMKYSYKNWDSELFFKYIDRFKLPQKKMLKKFSRGMKMKLSIAIALSHKAKFLVLDEATAGLDPVIRDEILDIFIDFVKIDGGTILISSHIISDLEKICTKIAFVHKGELVLYEDRDKIMEEYKIMECSFEEFETINSNYILGSTRSIRDMSYLVKDSTGFPGREKPYKTIEDIILLYIRGFKNR